MQLRRSIDLSEHLVYPIRPPRRTRVADRIAIRPARRGTKRFGPIRCTVCGERGYAEGFSELLHGLRETGTCSRCGATNRHRQLALVLAGSVPGARSLVDVVHLAEPVYHADPVNPVPGALVFTYFSLEMLVRLAELGFETDMYWLHRPSAGIVGQEATVFAAVRPARRR